MKAFTLIATWPAALLIVALCGAGPALRAQASPASTPPTAEQLAARRQQKADSMLHNDWANFERYRAANAALPAPTPGEARVVFMGNSITDGWARFFPTQFAGKPYIGRGIGGQTTPQMLVRFRADVVALHPRVVVILAGTNDIAFNTGPMTPDETKANIRAMTELAQANGIRVILASIPPADQYPWRPGLDTGRNGGDPVGQPERHAAPSRRAGRVDREFRAVHRRWSPVLA